MSVKNDIIKVTPPAFIEVCGMKETITSTDHPCGRCDGSGIFREDQPHGIVIKECPVCNGSGKLDAVITIEWKPSKQ